MLQMDMVFVIRHMVHSLSIQDEPERLRQLAYDWDMLLTIIFDRQENLIDTQCVIDAGHNCGCKRIHGVGIYKPAGKFPGLLKSSIYTHC